MLLVVAYRDCALTPALSRWLGEFLTQLFAKWLVVTRMHHHHHLLKLFLMAAHHQWRYKDIPTIKR